MFFFFLIPHILFILSRLPNIHCAFAAHSLANILSNLYSAFSKKGQVQIHQINLHLQKLQSPHID